MTEENPFAPGQAALDAPAAAHSTTFAEPRTFVIAGLYATAATELGSSVLMMVAGQNEGLLLLVGLTAIFQFGVFLLTVVLWCMWKYRAAMNLRALSDHGFEYTPGWAVGWYFVPFLNLFRPAQAMREIMAFSRPKDGGDGLLEDDGDKVVTRWWALWIGSNIVDNIAMRIETPMVSVIAAVIGVVAAILAVQVVKVVNDRQRQAARGGAYWVGV